MVEHKEKKNLLEEIRQCSTFIESDTVAISDIVTMFDIANSLVKHNN